MEEKQLTEEQIINQVKERLKGEFVQLFHEDGKPAGVGYCKSTKHVYKDIEALANDYYGIHTTDEEKKQLNGIKREEFREKERKKEADQFDKAEKKKFSEWDGEMVFYGEDHYYEICDFLESIFELYGANYDLYPKYVWATKPVPYITKKNAYDDVYQNDIESANCEFDLTIHGEKVLQMSLDAFVDANKENVLYWPDYSLALLIDDEIEEYRKRYEDE
ncbi:hypothetical protein KAR91_81255 [Candidatus Pacearchaeota archaeon]|nr:hypothetical protein [Candidatus Pacearchaeota archaeon]